MRAANIGKSNWLPRVLGLPNARFFVDRPAAISAEQERSLTREAKALGVSRGSALPTAYLPSVYVRWRR